MSSKWHLTTWIIAFSTSSKLQLGLVKRQKMSSHCLATNKKVVFIIQTSRILGWSWGRKEVESAMGAVETTLSRPQPGGILGWSRARTWVQCDMRCLKTSLSRIHPRRIFGWSRGRKFFPSAWRPLETSLTRPHQSRILGLLRGRKSLLFEFLVLQEAENDFKMTFDNLIHRFFDFIQTTFWVGQ